MYAKELFIIRVCLIIVCSQFFRIQSLHANFTEDKSKVGEILFISSYNSDTQLTYDNINNFIEQYKELGGKYEAVVENMNCTSLRYANTWSETMLNILSKHPRAELIILLGAEAWATYFSTQSKEYQKIPVFCAMSYRYAASLTSTNTMEPDYSETVDFLEAIKNFNVLNCYIYNYDVKKDIELIKDFYPDVKNIALLTDNTYNGINHLKQVKEVMEQYKELNLINIDGRKEGLDSALKLISDLPEKTVMLLGIWRIDKDDIVYINNAVYAMTTANPKLPVFSLTSTGIGYWAIGGYVPEYPSIGTEMAEKAYQLLDRHMTEPPRININRNQYTFDLKKLKEFDFMNKKLPTGSVFKNKEKTFYEQYKWQINSAITAFIALIIGLITSFYYYLRVCKLKNNLEHSEHQLRLEKESLEQSEHQLRLAKEQAEEASRMKSAFVSNMSHEIRTPLNAIVGFSSILVSEVKDNEELKDYVGIIHHNSDILLRLINCILDISVLESGKIKFNYELCNIVPHLYSVLRATEHGKAPDVETQFNPQMNELYIKTDIMQFQQIIINLLTNAMKFTKEGHIELAFEIDEPNGRVLFSVTDTGCGIPPDKRDKIFERFEKLNDFIQGTGLGLPTCQLIIAKLGGSIWIDSEYNNGARFVFSHPINNDTPHE